MWPDVLLPGWTPPDSRVSLSQCFPPRHHCLPESEWHASSPGRRSCLALLICSWEGGGWLGVLGGVFLCTLHNLLSVYSTACLHQRAVVGVT